MRRSAALVALAAIACLAAAGVAWSVAGTAPWEDEAAREPARSAAPVPASPQTPAATAAASVWGAGAGQGVRSGSVRLAVPAGRATGGFALWAFLTGTGLPAHMIVDPAGMATAITGCRPGRVLLRQCGGWATAAGELLIAGRSGPRVRAVGIHDRRGRERAAVVRGGSWLFHASGLLGRAGPSSRDPRQIVGRDVRGRLVVAIPVGTA